MCFGGGSSSQTVTQVPQPKSPEEIEAIKLALESLKMRQSLLPFVLENAGIGQMPEGGMTRLPPTPTQEAMNTLTTSSLGGANEALPMMLQRLRASQQMIPGLVSSVQASMPPGSRSSMPSIPSMGLPAAGIGPSGVPGGLSTPTMPMGNRLSALPSGPPQIGGGQRTPQTASLTEQLIKLLQSQPNLQSSEPQQSLFGFRLSQDPIQQLLAFLQARRFPG